ncbi:MAG: peptidoglycan hydrolase RipC, partial [Mycobacterium sp.]|nr:peptidoglycan hydrolase RipC [Mycobacterium sp.]
MSRFVGYPIARLLTRTVVCTVVGCTLLSGVMAASVLADPAQDALAKLNQLSRQAEQTTEAMHSAQLDLNNKLAAERAAEQKHADDQAAAQAAKARLASFQGAVNKLAAATYMGGRVDGVESILTAESPQGLIDKLVMQRVMASQMSTQMASFRLAGEQAAKAEQASARSAADAKSAAEQAAAVRAGLQAKQSQLQVQIAVVKSQYFALSAEQRTALADPGPLPEGAPPPQAASPGAPGGGGGQAPDEAPPPGGVPSAPDGGDRATVVQAALTQVGTPYAWGGAAPGGFDCSGLVMWAFQQAGISLPHSSQALARGGQPVALSD